MEMTDKEQIEMIKTWWRENGKFTIISIAIAIALSFGWRSWQNAKTQEAAKSSMLYEQLLGDVSSQNFTQAELDVTSMLTIHPKTPYAPLAAFISAQNAINKHDDQGALEKYNWVIQNAKSKDFQQIAKIRKARILVAEKKYDEALQALDPILASAYAPAINELKGDIFTAKHDYNQARSFYQQALHALKQDAANRPLLEMKLNQISG